MPPSGTPATNRRVALTAALLIGFAAPVPLSGALASTHPTADRPTTLTASQVSQMTRLTGWKGLAGHTFDVAEQYQSGPATIVVVELDGAPLGVPLAELQQDITESQQLAAQTPTFTSLLEVGPEPKQSIDYAVEPMGALAPRKPYTRYIIFTPQRDSFAQLMAPAVPISYQAVTLNRGTARINVTLLHDLPRTQHWGSEGFSAVSEYAMVESMNTSSLVYVPNPTVDRLANNHVDLSYLTTPTDPHPSKYDELQNLIGRGREIWANSLGFAISEARINTGYTDYVRRAKQQRFSFYRRNDMGYLVVGRDEYQELAVATPPPTPTPFPSPTSTPTESPTPTPV
jgi:hypothetical protein